MFNNNERLLLNKTRPPISPDKRKDKKEDTFFCPRVNVDTLFWCFYVMKNGITAYEMEPATFTKEKNEKIKYVQLLRDNKAILKSFNIRLLGEIENTLVHTNKIDLHAFFALCALEKINVIVVQNRIYADIIADTTNLSTYIIHHHSKNYKLEFIPRNLSELNYSQTHFKLPLKSVGGYKLNQLHEICTKLCIIIPNECKKKQDIYEIIKTTLNKID